MPPVRNTLHLHVRNGVTACGRKRGIYTPNVMFAFAFGVAAARGELKVCKKCKRHWDQIPGTQKHRPL